MSLLDKDGLREIAARGIEVGSHGMSHTRLAGVTGARLRREIFESRSVLQRTIGGPVGGFCYPYGSLDRAAVRAVRDAGYSYACSCRDRIESTTYDLPRPPVWEMNGPLLLKAKRRVYPVFSEVYSRVSGRYAAGSSEGL
jgi:peptidoglycan/xylan/chitin deacetylase (PgdA/CDA1 family)